MKTKEEIINYLYTENIYWNFIWKCITYEKRDPYCSQLYGSKSLKNNLTETLISRSFRWQEFKQFAILDKINQKYKEFYRE